MLYCFKPASPSSKQIALSFLVGRSVIVGNFIRINWKENCRKYVWCFAIAPLLNTLKWRDYIVCVSGGGGVQKKICSQQQGTALNRPCVFAGIKWHGWVTHGGAVHGSKTWAYNDLICNNKNNGRQQTCGRREEMSYWAIRGGGGMGMMMMMTWSG